jgi:hypothetical protein
MDILFARFLSVNKSLPMEISLLRLPALLDVTVARVTDPLLKGVIEQGDNDKPNLLLERQPLRLCGIIEV